MKEYTMNNMIPLQGMTLSPGAVMFNIFRDFFLFGNISLWLFKNSQIPLIFPMEYDSFTGKTDGQPDIFSINWIFRG